MLEQFERTREALERERAERVEMERRRAVKAKAQYSVRSMSPWDVFDILPPREKGWDAGRKPSEKMLACLDKAGINTNGLSFGQAKALIGQVFGRREHGLASFKQMKVLRKHGLDCKNWTFERASKAIDAIAKNNWQVPDSLKEQEAPF